MRYDIVSYLIGIICFTMAFFMIPLWGVTLIPVAVLISFLLFGLFFMAYGYSVRPRVHVRYKQIQSIAPIETEKIEEEPSTLQSTPSKPTTELNRIKGIGPKRMARLKATGIVSVEDLLHFSADDLAGKLAISDRITVKWLEQARDLMQNASARSPPSKPEVS